MAPKKTIDLASTSTSSKPSKPDMDPSNFVPGSRILEEEFKQDTVGRKLLKMLGDAKLLPLFLMDESQFVTIICAEFFENGISTNSALLDVRGEPIRDLETGEVKYEDAIKSTVCGKPVVLTASKIAVLAGLENSGVMGIKPELLSSTTMELIGVNSFSTKNSSKKDFGEVMSLLCDLVDTGVN